MREIAEMLEVSPNTVAREIKFGCKFIATMSHTKHFDDYRRYGNSRNKIYDYKFAHEKAKKRVKKSHKYKKLRDNEILKSEVISMLEKGYKPDAIARKTTT
jgi:IS30 family transposase